MISIKNNTCSSKSTKNKSYHNANTDLSCIVKSLWRSSKGGPGWSLEFFEPGGRVSNMASLMGTLLKINGLGKEK